jgi:hypothetical protein
MLNTILIKSLSIKSLLESYINLTLAQNGAEQDKIDIREKENEKVQF